MSRIDDFSAEINRANIVRKEKTKWNSKQAHRVRAVVAPGQAHLPTISNATAQAMDERQRNYERFHAEPRPYFAGRE